MTTILATALLPEGARASLPRPRRNAIHQELSDQNASDAAAQSTRTSAAVHEAHADKKLELAVKLSSLKTAPTEPHWPALATPWSASSPARPPPSTLHPNQAPAQHGRRSGLEEHRDMPREAATLIAQHAFREKKRKGQPPLTVAQHREAVRKAHELASATPTVRGASARQGVAEIRRERT